MPTTKDPAATIRAQQYAAAQAAAKHDEPLLAKLLEQLESIQPTATEIHTGVASIITPYLHAQTRSLAQSISSLVDSVKSAQRQTAATLAEAPPEEI
jgi:hypothetical protein